MLLLLRIDGKTLAACILNKLCGQLQIPAIKARGIGDKRKSIRSNLVALDDGAVFARELDIKPRKVTADLIGFAGSITITRADTIVLNGGGPNDYIQARCELICSFIADPTTSAV